MRLDKAMPIDSLCLKLLPSERFQTLSENCLTMKFVKENNSF